MQNWLKTFTYGSIGLSVALAIGSCGSKSGGGGSGSDDPLAPGNETASPSGQQILRSNLKQWKKMTIYDSLDRITTVTTANGDVREIQRFDPDTGAPTSKTIITSTKDATQQPILEITKNYTSSGELETVQKTTTSRDQHGNVLEQSFHAGSNEDSWRLVDRQTRTYNQDGYLQKVEEFNSGNLLKATKSYEYNGKQLIRFEHKDVDGKILAKLEFDPATKKSRSESKVGYNSIVVEQEYGSNNVLTYEESIYNEEDLIAETKHIKSELDGSVSQITRKKTCEDQGAIRVCRELQVDDITKRDAAEGLYEYTKNRHGFWHLSKKTVTPSISIVNSVTREISYNPQDNILRDYNKNDDGTSESLNTYDESGENPLEQKYLLDGKQFERRVIEY